jgi:DNA (cytosine-5)-methyltransferase 1
MIKVVDIFAGPGGLGEGFSSFSSRAGVRHFDVVLSVEMERFAFETLQLRTFFRQFPTRVPTKYYQHLRGEITRDELYASFKAEATRAAKVCWHTRLGPNWEPQENVRKRIDSAIKTDEPWVLLGGPPCQAYSIAGRSRNSGNPDYDPKKDLRQNLYVEYLQILAEHSPAVFVMENVKGLLSATVGNTRMFQRILEDLQNPKLALSREGRSTRRCRNVTYKIYSLVTGTDFNDSNLDASVVKAEFFGIPQARHRVILLGVRNDFRSTPPRQLNPRTMASVESVIKSLPPIRSGLSKQHDSPQAWNDFLRSQLDSRWVKTESPKVGGTKLKNVLREILRTIRPPKADRGGEFLRCEAQTDHLPSWYSDVRIGGICNHSARGHMAQDLSRYLFAASFAKVHGKSPTLENFPTSLLPRHGNVADAIKKGGTFSDRFRVQIENRPATTVVSHISKDGHYYIHPDPTQCRSLTVREAARLQTFPDNYLFCGPRTAQYTQVGNAVPPYLAKQIAEIVFHLLEAPEFEN